MMNHVLVTGLLYYHVDSICDDSIISTYGRVVKATDSNQMGSSNQGSIPWRCIFKISDLRFLMLDFFSLHVIRI